MRPGIWQIVLVIVVIAVLFGSAKIPELARSLGKAKGEFKKGLREGEDDEIEKTEGKEENNSKELT